MEKLNVYLEIGNKRTFAGAIDWPGWCRSGRDPESALRELFDYGPRYARVLGTARLGFRAPADKAAFQIIERIAGNATTDFGAPGAAPSSDGEPVDEKELKRLGQVLKAAWRAFDAAVGAAAGIELRKGPRGGGRETEAIVEHVAEAGKSYLAQLGLKFERGPASDPGQDLGRVRQAILKGLATAVEGKIPVRGPRGGLRWTPRYFVRRVAWHVFDHAWEIEDRIG